MIIAKSLTVWIHAQEMEKGVKRANVIVAFFDESYAKYGAVSHFVLAASQSSTIGLVCSNVLSDTAADGTGVTA